MKSINAKYKELGKHGFIYGIGSAIQSAINIFLIPLFLVSFTPEEFGVYSILSLTSSLCGAFFYFGSSSAFSRFYFDKVYSGNQDKLFQNSLTICFFGAFLMILLCFIFKNVYTASIVGSKLYSVPFMIMIFNSSLIMINTNFFLLLRLKKKSLLFVLSNITSLIVTVVASILLVKYLPNKIIGVSVGSLIGSFMVFLSLAIPNVKIIRLNYDKQIVKSFIKFGLPIAIASFLYLFLDWIIRYLVSIKLGPTELGLFSMGKRFAMLISAGFVTPFSFIWSVMRLEYRKDINSQLFNIRIFTYYFLIGLFLVNFFTLSINGFYLFFSNINDYSLVVQITPLMLAGQLMFGAINIVDYGIYINNKTKYFVISSIIAILIVFIIGMLTIEHTGILGASFIYFFGFLTLFVSISLFSSKFLELKIDKKRIIIMLVGGLSIYFITWYIISNYKISKISIFLINLVLSTLYFLLLILLMYPEDRRSAFNYLKSKILKMNFLSYEK